MVARAVRDHITDGGPQPWALEVARDCRTFNTFPRVGGWADQDEVELVLMRVATTAETVYSKQVSGGSWTESEADFVGWVEDNG